MKSKRLLINGNAESAPKQRSGTSQFLKRPWVRGGFQRTPEPAVRTRRRHRDGRARDSLTVNNTNNNNNNNSKNK